MNKELFLLLVVIVLSFTAEKCRHFVGEESSSRSWTERFTFLNCFDMKYGSIACIATKKALEEHLARGKSSEDAIKAARATGKAASRRASLQWKHVMGPLLSAGWDLFETIYVGGSSDEGLVRCCGTFFGAFVGGLIGEGKLGWLGFLLGSQFGSWIGSRVGLMLFDVSNGVQQSSSRSWTERFTFLNCFDMKYGSIACIVKELIKLYLYYIRAVHVHKVRDEATKKALEEHLARGKSSENAIKARVMGRQRQEELHCNGSM
ncbi:hypothetical protein Leryth_011211 [Lithospermum erythrorhizon]|nr:hypothetical protein Leryth_011211 [Lithospermum erythrorhizon]